MNSVPFNGQDYEKQKGHGTKDLSKNSVRIPLLVMFDGKIQSYSKITFANLCMPVHDIINYFTFIYPFNLVSVERKGKNYKNLNISRTKGAC